MKYVWVVFFSIFLMFVLPQNVESYSIPLDTIPFQNNDSEGMSLESLNFFRTLYFAKLALMINESIQSLPDDVYFDSTNKDDFKEILVSGDDNIYDLFSKSNVFYFDPKENINNFYEATTKLSELKTRMDSSIGGNPSDDWIVDQNSQNLILEKIDFALDEYLQSVGGNLNPVSIEDYDDNWWDAIRMYQENAKFHLGYLCYSESLKKSPSENRINLEIPECQTWIAKSFPPIKQIRIGILPDKIQCDEGLELIFKSADGSPACVKPKTAEKLIERGWAVATSQMEFTTISGYQLVPWTIDYGVETSSVIVYGEIVSVETKNVDKSYTSPYEYEAEKRFQYQAIVPYQYVTIKVENYLLDRTGQYSDLVTFRDRGEGPGIINGKNTFVKIEYFTDYSVGEKGLFYLYELEEELETIGVIGKFVYDENTGKFQNEIFERRGISPLNLSEHKIRVDSVLALEDTDIEFQTNSTAT